ncbi:MAG: FAD-binding protein [Lachnospiraceae bacterium]|nr:FAD-binding protein [Lachnospiraceae bacterium]
MSKNLSRREFLKSAAAGAAGLAASSFLSACVADIPEAESRPAESSESIKPESQSPETSPETTAVEKSVTDSKSGDFVLNAKNYNQTKWSFEIPPEPIPDSEIKETITHDIIIIGAGMAGLVTMCSAMEKGADCYMFSASTRPYSRGGSNHAIGSKYQKAKGVKYDPEIAREIVKAEQTAGTYFMDKKKWERWINNSAESIDWTIDKMAAKGLKASLEPGYWDPDGTLTVPHASHNFYNEEQPFGALFGAPMQAQAYADTITDDLHGTIEYETVAKYLIREDNNTGRVSAVVAQRKDGSYVKYVGRKAIVMATGDFSTNHDMMAKYSPWAYEIFKDQLKTETNYDSGLDYDGLMPGDGQKMGLWVGAAWQKTFPNAPMINGGVSGPAHAVISNFWGLNVDIHGNRFQNEVTNFAYGAISLLQLPERTAYGIWGENYAYTQKEWEPFGHCIDEENGIKAYTPEEYIEQWKSRYMHSDTIEGLVDQFDMSEEDKKNCIETIKRYDRYARNGLDEEYHVNPEVLYPIEGPYYASKNTGATFLTVCGGLRTNEKMQVCDANDKPIEGLYNTGIMTGDFYANTYNFVMPGQNLGAVCGTLSYLLGRDLAEL